MPMLVLGDSSFLKISEHASKNEVFTKHNDVIEVSNDFVIVLDSVNSNLVRRGFYGPLKATYE